MIGSLTSQQHEQMTCNLERKERQHYHERIYHPNHTKYPDHTRQRSHDDFNQLSPQWHGSRLSRGHRGLTGQTLLHDPGAYLEVKRLARNPRVTVAPGTFKGEALGPAIEGTARRLSDKELQRARDLLRVGVVGHFWGFIFDLRYPGDKTAVYEISLVAENVDQEMIASSHSQH